MFLALFDPFEILLLIIVCVIFIAIASFFIVRDLKKEYAKMYKVRSRFHIEMRKIVNLIYNVYNTETLEPFTKVIIKNLPHTEKAILLRKIDAVYQSIDLEDPNNKYIHETYENLQKLRRERDAKLLTYNQKLRTFPFSVYARIMKLNKYELYTEKY